MPSDYCLAYGISGGEKGGLSIHPDLHHHGCSLGGAYVGMVVPDHLGLESANKFFKEILNSILHAPISFDTTLSGRVLSKVHLSGASCHYFSMPTSL